MITKKRLIIAIIAVALGVALFSGTVENFFRRFGEIEIDGPESAEIGQLCVYSVDSENAVAWTVTPSGIETYQDSGNGKLVLSSASAGEFVVIAATTRDGAPVIAQTTIIIGVGGKNNKKEKTKPQTIEDWVQKNLPEEADESDYAAVASIFEDAASALDRGVISTIDAAQTKIRAAAQNGPDLAVWGAFYDGLAERIKKEPNKTAAEFGALLRRVSDALREWQREWQRCQPPPNVPAASAPSKADSIAPEKPEAVPPAPEKPETVPPAPAIPKEEPKPAAVRTVQPVRTVQRVEPVRYYSPCQNGNCNVKY